VAACLKDRKGPFAVSCLFVNTQLAYLSKRWSIGKPFTTLYQFIQFQFICCKRTSIKPHDHWGYAIRIHWFCFV